MGDNLPAVDLGSGRMAQAISVSQDATCALLDNATVKCWGWNADGQLGQGDTESRGDNAGEMGDNLPAVNLGTGRTAVAVSAGTRNTCALLDHGDVKCWGYNFNGQLGLEDRVNRGGLPGQMGNALPTVNLGTGRTATAVLAAQGHSCAVLDDGSLKCWGSATQGVLGNGSPNGYGGFPGTMGDNLPTVRLGSGRTVLAISSGGGHNCAKLDDGHIKCWGPNHTGQLGLGDIADRGDSSSEMGNALPNVDLGSYSVSPALTLVKSADESSVLEGAAIHYHVTVNNTGNVVLHNVTVSDPNAPGCTASVGTLAVGASSAPINCAHTTTSGDVGTYSNTASATADEVTTPVASNRVDVTVTQAQQAQTIEFAQLPDRTFGDADFGLSASSTSGLEVSFSAAGACTVSGATVHLTGAGQCTITASQAGSGSYLPAPDVERSFAVEKASQEIDFAALPDRTFGDADFDVSASASSGLGVSLSATGACSVSGVTVHLSGAGDCTVTASQPGNANFLAADEMSRTFGIGRAAQSITFSVGNHTFGDPDFELSATASSGLDVAFSIDSGRCDNEGSTLHINGAGDCTVIASQAGNSDYLPAEDVVRTFNVARADQSIEFEGLAGRTFGDADFEVTALASSGLDVSFSATGACTVDGTTLHLTGAGDCTVTASQPGNEDFNPASDVPQTFSVAPSGQSILFGPLQAATFGDADFEVAALASSGLPVSFAATGDCQILGSTVHIVGVGECTVTASQPGDTNYTPAEDVSQSFTIGKASQSLSFAPLVDRTFGEDDFDVAATASSGLDVSFAASGACTVSGATVHIVSAGECVLTASQPGDESYLAAADVTQSFIVAKSSQVIDFDVSGHTYGDADFDVSASASSGLDVSFAVSVGQCTLTGATVHIAGAGDCTITASQAGDANYLAAADVDRTFTISQASQTITFSPIDGHIFGDEDFDVVATSSSGLPVSFAAAGACSVSGSTVSIVGSGECTVVASQGGDANYNPASDVSRTFAVAPASQTIDFGALADRAYYDADFEVYASASSNLPVSFTASGSCSVMGVTVSVTGTGSCAVTAHQGGSTNFEPAPDVTQSFSVIDDRAPVAAPSVSPAPNAAGWNNTDVVVTWHWLEPNAASGVDPAQCTNSSTSSGEGVLTFNVSCIDRAGNIGRAAYQVKVDKTGPALAPVVSPNPVALNGTASVSPGATDGVSGVASATCGPLNTATTGTKTVTCTATDNAGNSRSVSVSYTVTGQRVPVTKDECKNNGWRTLTDSAGVPFRNQGDCVSYVATH